MPWLPTLFAAESIPSAMITFVALLMFLQLGIGWESSTLLASLLMVPWLVKSLVRRRLRSCGHFAWQLRVAELLTVLQMVALSFAFTAHHDRRLCVFCFLFGLCLLTAWHELVARMYFEQRLRRPQRRFYSVAKMSFSQAAVVLTYGVMIVVVGVLEVFNHQRPQVMAESWSTAVYLLTGAYLLLILWNWITLRNDRQAARSDEPAERAEDGPSFMAPSSSFCASRSAFMMAVSLFLLLLPQALMFHARVLFLLALPAEGGLGCSLQWVGLAQGTVGVIAFSIGLIVGHRLLSRSDAVSSFNRRLASMTFALGLSPLVYWLMTQYPPTTLLWLCVATASAQFCFGYGLNATMPFLRHFFRNRYQETINYLYVPLITLLMLPSMAASGWLVMRLGFPDFFLIDSLLAIPAWMAAYVAFHSFHYAKQTLRLGPLPLLG